MTSAIDRVMEHILWRLLLSPAAGEILAAYLALCPDPSGTCGGVSPRKPQPSGLEAAPGRAPQRAAGQPGWAAGAWGERRGSLSAWIWASPSGRDSRGKEPRGCPGGTPGVFLEDERIWCVGSCSQGLQAACSEPPQGPGSWMPSWSNSPSWRVCQEHMGCGGGS